VSLTTGHDPGTVSPDPVVDLSVSPPVDLSGALPVVVPDPPRRQWWRRPRRLLSLALVVVLAVLLGPWALVSLSTDGARYEIGDVPAAPVAIVFGAGLAGPDEPSQFLAQRLDLAVDLWQQQKVRHILVSGDNATVTHDEVGVMRDYLVRHGVPAGVITEDHAGYDTYDSCYRARAVFGVTRAVLVTQNYHLARALWDCQGQGLHVVGVGGSEGLVVKLQEREILSDAKALVQRIFKPTPSVVGPALPLN
jgi:vancomycin permeability regulator SanA